MLENDAFVITDLDTAYKEIVAKPFDAIISPDMYEIDDAYFQNLYSFIDYCSDTCNRIWGRIYVILDTLRDTPLKFHLYRENPKEDETKTTYSELMELHKEMLNLLSQLYSKTKNVKL